MSVILQTTERRSCPGCQLLRINGVLCHEISCPDAWRDETRECRECGTEFKPEFRGQTCCDTECAQAYHGV